MFHAERTRLRRVPLRLLIVMLVASMVALPVATAQEENDDPTCEEDSSQLGCEEGCELTPEGCAHPPCPTDLAGYAPETGGVFMSWTLNSYSDIRIYRNTTDGGFEPIDYKEFPTTRYLDHDTVEGETYRYQVTAVGMHQYNESRPAEGESPACSTLEVTTVPFFSGPVMVAVAAVLVTIGYVGLGRRRFGTR